jgi:hypothetical protein
VPFLPAGVGAAVAGGVAAGAIGVAGNAIVGGLKSGDVAAGAGAANAVLAPYSTTGVQSDTQQANLLGLNGQPAADAAMSTFQASPGYQYDLTQGLKAVDAGAASKGLLRSGATIKAEQAYGSNLADNEFSNYVGRLNSLTNFGVTAAGGQASTDTSAGAAQANIAGTAGTGITNSLSGLAGNTNVQNALTSMFSGPTTTGMGSGSGTTSMLSAGNAAFATDAHPNGG